MIKIESAKERRPITLNTLCAVVIYALYAILMFYMQYYQNAVIEINRLPLITGGALAGLSILLAYRSREKIRVLDILPIEYVPLLFFLVWCYMGVFFWPQADHMANITRLSFLLLECIILAICVFIVSWYAKSITPILVILTAISIVSATNAIVYGYEQVSGRVALAESSNANFLSNILFMGLFCTLLMASGKSVGKKLLIITPLAAYQIYALLLTGSRKTFLGMIALFGLYFLFCFIPKQNNSASLKRVVYILSTILIIILFIPVIWSYLGDTEAASRLTNLSSDASYNARVNMHIDAFKLFMQYPLYGVGLAGFQLVSGYATYSHSTYAEVLSCTGIVGTILYFAFLVLLASNMRKALLVAKTGNNYKSYEQIKICISMFIIMIFLGFGTIHFYEIISTVCLSIMTVAAKSAYWSKESLPANTHA